MGIWHVLLTGPTASCPEFSDSLSMGGTRVNWGAVAVEVSAVGDGRSSEHCKVSVCLHLPACRHLSESRSAPTLCLLHPHLLLQELLPSFPPPPLAVQVEEPVAVQCTPRRGRGGTAAACPPRLRALVSRGGRRCCGAARGIWMAAGGQRLPTGGACPAWPAGDAGKEAPRIAAPLLQCMACSGGGPARMRWQCMGWRRSIVASGITSHSLCCSPLLVLLAGWGGVGPGAAGGIPPDRNQGRGG